MRKNGFVPVVILFIILNALFLSFRTRWENWGVDNEVLVIGNLFLFIITLGSFLIARRGLHSKNGNAFMRSVYGSIMFKMFLCIAGALIYIAVNKKELNKPGLFICMGLYLVYTFMEVSTLTRLLRQKPHA
ncbi:MAG TPA: hypothetical protein VM871_00755 [Flavisolibacter sp.]|nr:hypothetical protein [Flavisolibacter sp.]